VPFEVLINKLGDRVSLYHVSVPEEVTGETVAGAQAKADAAQSAAIAAAAADAASRVATEVAARAAAVTALIDGAPGALDTLNEIATALADDEAAASALTTAVAGKASKSSNLSDLTDPVAARGSLGLGTAATHAHEDYDPAGSAASAIATASADATAKASAAEASAIAAAATDATTKVNAEAAARATAISNAIANLINSAPGTMDTLGEIAALLAADESTAAALATTVALKAPLASPVFTGNPTAPTPSPGDSDTSLATTAFVTGAITDAAPKYGLLSAMPANGATPNGSLYFATDQAGGTLYEQIAGVQTPITVGLANAVTGFAVGPAILSSTFDIKAIGTTPTDVTGLSLSVPASAVRGIMLRFKAEAIMNGGTATANALLRMLLTITDNSNNVLSENGMAITSVALSRNILGSITVEKWLPAPVSAATYKIRAFTAEAVPANWTSAALQPGYGAVGAENYFTAEYK